MTFSNPSSLSAIRNVSLPTEILLSWTYTPNNGYAIYRSENSGIYTLVATLPADIGFGAQPFGTSTFGRAYSDDITWTDNSVNPALPYDYRIHVYDQGVQIDPGTISNHVNAFQLAWVNAGRRRYDAGVELTWDNISGATAFKIYRSVNNAAYSLYYTTPTGSSFTYTDTGSNHLAKNQYKVSIMVGAVESGLTTSNAILADAPLPVSNVVATKTAKTIVITWTNTEQGEGVKIYRSVNDAAPTLITISPLAASAVSYTDSAVSMGNKYKYFVAQFTTDGGEARVPSNEETIVDTLSFTWTRGAGSKSDEFFELSIKYPELNFNPLHKNPILQYADDAKNCPVIRSFNNWTVLGEQTDLDFTLNVSNRAKYVVLGIRSRDAFYNYSTKKIQSVQV